MIHQDIKDLSELAKIIEKTTRPAPANDDYLQINSRVFQARLKGKSAATKLHNAITIAHVRDMLGIEGQQGFDN